MTVYSIYKPLEIIQRILEEVAPLDGPSGYPVQIKYVADNSTEPPVIYVDLYEGADCSVFDMYIDQNTTLKEFEVKLYSSGLHSLRTRVRLCLEAKRQRTSFDIELKKVSKPKINPEDEFPF